MRDDFVGLDKPWTLPPDLSSAVLHQCVLHRDLDKLVQLFKQTPNVVLQGYPWISDLSEGGVPINKTLDLLLKSENLDWIHSEEMLIPDKEADRYGDMTAENFKHYSGCAHKICPSDTSDLGSTTSVIEKDITTLVSNQVGAGVKLSRASEPSYIDSPETRSAHLASDDSDPEKRLDDLERWERALIGSGASLNGYVGIAGVFPPLQYERARKTNPEFAQFHRRVAEIFYGSRWSPTRSHPVLDPTFEDQVREALENLISGITFLSKEPQCCDRFTLFVKSQSRSSVIDVRTIEVSKLLEILGYTQEISRGLMGQHRPEVIQALLKCCVGMLVDLGCVENNAQDRSIESFEPLLYCLDVCALVIQMALLALVIYSKGHSRDFYTSHLTRLIDYFVLRGSCSSYRAARLRLLDPGKRLTMMKPIVTGVPKWSS